MSAAISSAVTLQLKGVIPEEIADDIANVHSTTNANRVLYGHLHSQASEDDLKHLFELCSEIQGYSRMNDFGKEMLRELQGKLAFALTLLKVTASLYDCPWLQVALLALDNVRDRRQETRLLHHCSLRPHNHIHQQFFVHTLQLPPNAFSGSSVTYTFTHTLSSVLPPNCTCVDVLTSTVCM